MSFITDLVNHLRNGGIDYVIFVKHAQLVYDTLDDEFEHLICHKTYSGYYLLRLKEEGEKMTCYVCTECGKKQYTSSTTASGSECIYCKGKVKRL